MVVVVKKGTDEQQLSHLIDWLKSMDIDVHFSAGKYETVLGLIGDTKKCKAAIGILFGIQLVLTAVLFCSHHKLGRDIRGMTGKGT